MACLTCDHAGMKPRRPVNRAMSVVVAFAFLVLSACVSRSGVTASPEATDAIRPQLKAACRKGIDVVVGLVPCDNRQYDTAIVAVFAELSETERGEIGSDFRSGIRQLASDPMRGFVTIEFDTQAAPEELNAVSSILDASKHVTSTFQCT